jgi:hypothetical protein
LLFLYRLYFYQLYLVLLRAAATAAGAEAPEEGDI